MENNQFKQFCDYINYNKIGKKFALSGCAVGLIDKLMLSQYQNLYKPVDVLACSLITLSAICFSLKGIYCKKDDNNEVRKLYQTFIKNYSKLNNLFDLNNPIQIYTMYNYLLYKGYLSVNKTFEYDEKVRSIIINLPGINVIMRKGVCRPISTMFNDILNDYGIESSVLGVSVKDYSKISAYLDYAAEGIIKRIKNVENEEIQKNLMESLEKAKVYQKENIEKYSKMLEKDKYLLQRIFGNHVINFAVKDGKSYFLDATNFKTYRIDKSNKVVLSDDKVIRCLIKTITSNSFKDYLKTRKNLSKQYPSINIEEEKEMIDTTKEICQSNIDIFEQFYIENKELYNDVSSRALVLAHKK